MDHGAGRAGPGLVRRRPGRRGRRGGGGETRPRADARRCRGRRQCGWQHPGLGGQPALSPGAVPHHLCRAAGDARTAAERGRGRHCADRSGGAAELRDHARESCATCGPAQCRPPDAVRALPRVPHGRVSGRASGVHAAAGRCGDARQRAQGDAGRHRQGRQCAPGRTVPDPQDRRRSHLEPQAEIPRIGGATLQQRGDRRPGWQLPARAHHRRREAQVRRSEVAEPDREWPDPVLPAGSVVAQAHCRPVAAGA